MRHHHELGLANIAILLVAALALGGVGLGVGLTLSGVVDPLGDDVASGEEAPLRSQANLLECPGEHIVDEVFDQDLVYVVGFDPTGDWAAVRRPGDLSDVGWIPTDLLDSEADMSGLPVRPCNEALTLVAPSQETEADSPVTAEPTTTPTLPAATTTPGPTATTAPGPTATPTPTVTPTPTPMPTATPTPMPTATPTPPADTTAPILVDSSANAEVYPEACPGSGRNTQASVYITAAGETAVTATLSWTYMNSSDPYSGTTPVGDPESSGSPPLFQLIGHVSAMPDPYPYPSYFPAADVTIVFTWSVTDDAGNTRQQSKNMALGRCP